MKFDCGPTWEETKAELESWHEWFAWHPVRIGSHDCRWLETVERRGTFFAFAADFHWIWEYRPVAGRSEK